MEQNQVNQENKLEFEQEVKLPNIKIDKNLIKETIPKIQPEIPKPKLKFDKKPPLKEEPKELKKISKLNKIQKKIEKINKEEQDFLVSGDLDTPIAMLSPYFHLNPAYDIATPEREKLNFIYNWSVKNIESQNKTDIKLFLTRIESKLGAPPMGVSRLQHIYNYAKLHNYYQQLKEII